MRRLHLMAVLLAAALPGAIGCSDQAGPGVQPTGGVGGAPVFGPTGAVGGAGGSGGESGAGAGGLGGVSGAAGSGGEVSVDAGAVKDAASDIDAAVIDAGPEPEPEPMCDLPPPEDFEPNESVGGGGSQFVESDHFRIYGSPSDPSTALNHLEAAHKCFVEDWCFRSTGLSVHDDDDSGPYYKLNVYGVSTLSGAAGVMRYDDGAGLAYLEVVNSYVPNAGTVIHEYGHAITMTEFGWANQGRTGAWWETIANWFADTYLTSDYCKPARDAFGVPAGDSRIDLDVVIGQSHRLIVSDQNNYQAWPFFTYLTNNPDHYAGLGRMTVANLFRQHAGNNETPLHVLERLATPVTVQTILGRYWARMAYLDLEHPIAQQEFIAEQGGLNYENLDPSSGDTYVVKSARRPAYGGANIIPLDASDTFSVQVTNLGNGLPESNFTATLAIQAADRSVRYIDLPSGAGTAELAQDEEATLVVANTPDTLYLYNAFDSEPGDPETVGLNYEVTFTGAMPRD